MVDINEGIKDVTKLVDDSFTTSEESAMISTRRQEIDLASPFKLPHMIRPYITIYAGFMWGLSIIWVLILATLQSNPIEAAMTMLSPDSIIMYVLAATTTTFGACVSWYFHSRGQEKREIIKAKAEMKKTDAAIDIRRLETKEEFRKDRAEEKRKKREARQDRQKQ